MDCLLLVSITIIRKSEVGSRKSGDRLPSLSLSVPQSLSLSIPQFLSLSVPQSLSLSVPQSLSLSVPQSLSLSVPQSLSLSVPQSPHRPFAPSPSQLTLHASTLRGTADARRFHPSLPLRLESHLNSQLSTLNSQLSTLNSQLSHLPFLPEHPKLVINFLLQAPQQ